MSKVSELNASRDDVNDDNVDTDAKEIDDGAPVVITSQLLAEARRERTKSRSVFSYLPPLSDFMQSFSEYFTSSSFLIISARSFPLKISPQIPKLTAGKSSKFHGLTEMGQFHGSARNFVARGKLCALLIMLKLFCY